MGDFHFPDPDTALLTKCTHCGVCEQVCSIYISTGENAPHEKLEVAREILEAGGSGGEKPKSWETVFLCTKCEACNEACPEEIPVSELVDLARRTVVDNWGVQYTRQEVITRNVLETGNPFGERTDRLAWCPDELRREVTSGNAGTLLHLGCMFSYRFQGVARNILSVLRKLEIPFTVSPEEQCCGYFTFNAGMHEVAAGIAEGNMEVFRRHRRVVTACAGCFTFMKENYPLEEEGIELEHLVEVVARALESRPRPKPKAKGRFPAGPGAEHPRATYADACHLTRPHGITGPPRAILEWMGIDITEFPRHGTRNLCCGADGGMRIINPDLARQIGRERVEEAREGADELITTCPFCHYNFYEAAKTSEVQLDVRNIFQLLDEVLDSPGDSRAASSQVSPRIDVPAGPVGGRAEAGKSRG
ncbi:MAG: (Fe-S)-binding protein [Promethearchaeota archaeon]